MFLRKQWPHSVSELPERNCLTFSLYLF